MGLPAVFILFLLLFSVNAFAEDGIMRGFGLSSCSELASRHKKDKQFTEMVYGTWIVGFISGIIMQPVADKKPRHLIPVPLTVFEGVKQRCESRPDEPVYYVLVDYVTTLPHGAAK